jgi:Cd2+/Zn2+-exporting ATPase
VEKTIEIEVRSLLPGVETDEDACIKRLESAMQSQRQMQKAHLERGEGPVKLCLHYDSEAVSVADVKKAAERAGVSIVNRYHHEIIPINGVDCSDCSLVIEHTLSRLDGVLSARMNYASKKLWIEYDTHQISRRMIEQRLHSLGYSIPLDGRRAWLAENRELLTSLFSGLLVLLGWGGSRWLAFPFAVSLVLFIAAYICGGWEIARHAFHSLRENEFDTDLLMLIAALGAAALGNFTEGALLIFLFSLGHSLEERALEHARSAVESLADLTPKTALVRRSGVDIELPVEQLALDDVLIVRPGARIPADGSILSGSSAVDQSPITGESIPVEKTNGDPVFAGTINGDGAIQVRVTRLTADSTLSRVMKMVEEAQTQKSPSQQVMEKFERIYVPGILISTFLVVLVPPLFGVPFHDSFMRAMTLLVAASPCALALGTPATVLAGIAQAARNGVLVKGGAHLETLGQIKAVAFDKTGTITAGKPEVTDVIALHPDEITEEMVVALTAAVENRSGHPLAQAVVRAAASCNLSPVDIGAVESLTSRGLLSSWNGKRVLVGSLKMAEEEQIDVPPAVVQKITAFEGNGKTTILLIVDSIICGILALSDTLRPEVRDMLGQLRRLGIEHTVMLTGDNPNVAAAIASQAGLTDFYAGLMPEDKANAILELQKKTGITAMVGDGVNDTPALASAAVGIAMGGASTDAALEVADVALMGNDLSHLPFAVGLGRKTRQIIVQNLVIAVGVIALLVVAALTGWVGMGIAIIFHEGSTIVVILNALRLLGYRG